MQRRMLAKTALATAAAALPASALAQYGMNQGSGMSQGGMGMSSAMDTGLNVVFTEENPGHWQQVAQLHVPNMTVADGQLSVVTPHPMTEAHYIVSHTVVLENGQFLDRQTFSWKDQPASKHTLPAGYSGRVTVTSTCNLHDFWVKTMTI